MCNINTYPQSHRPNKLIPTLILKKPPLSFKQRRKKLTLQEKICHSSYILCTTLLIFMTPIFLQLVLAQVPATCPSVLLSLAPCGPFVQGFVQLPAQPCCNGLNQIYSQEPTCLSLSQQYFFSVPWFSN